MRARRFVGFFGAAMFAVLVTAAAQPPEPIFKDELKDEVKNEAPPTMTPPAPAAAPRAAAAAPVVVDPPAGSRHSIAPRAAASSSQRVDALRREPTVRGAALLALVTALGIGFAALGRLRSAPPASRGQRAAGRVQVVIALSWLACFIAFAASSLQARNPAASLASGSSSWLLPASAAAFIASALTLLSAPLLFAVWRGNLQGAGWPVSRKFRYTAAFVAFAAFAILLGARGVLEPWRF